MAIITTIDALLPELLSQVFQHSYLGNSPAGSLFSCLLVCKRWMEITLPILYRNLTLGSDRLTRFLAGFNRQAVCSFTRSLTIRLDAARGGEAPPESDMTRSLPPQGPDDWLGRFTENVLLGPAAPRLISCSFSTTRVVTSASISAVLRALPTCCVNLEIDTGDCDVDGIDDAYVQNDDYGPGTNNRVHLCDELRPILPRLHQARIKLRDICGAIVSIYDAEDENGFRAIPLPSMQLLLVSCRDGRRVNAHCPRQRREGLQEPRPTSWHSIIRSMQHVARLTLADGQKMPSMVVTTIVGGSGDNRAKYKTLLRCHVGQSDEHTTTWAFPAVNLPPVNLEDPEKDYVDVSYIRTERGGLVTTGYTLLAEVAENHPWRKLKTGARLPSADASACWIPQECSEKWRVWTEAEWRRDYPRKMCMLWYNEERSGMRLLDAEERRDTDLRCLVEMTPAGWVRPASYNRERLFREEDDYWGRRS